MYFIFDYILKNLEDIEIKPPSPHDMKRITDLIERTPQLRSKKDLIEKFINEVLGNIDTKQTTVSDVFAEFMRKERRKAFCNLIEEERLNETIARKVINYYEFTGKFDEDLIKEIFEDGLKFLEKIERVKDIKEKIEEIVEKFTY